MINALATLSPMMLAQADLGGLLWLGIVFFIIAIVAYVLGARGERRHDHAGFPCVTTTTRPTGTRRVRENLAKVVPMVWTQRTGSGKSCRRARFSGMGSARIPQIHRCNVGQTAAVQTR